MNYLCITSPASGGKTTSACVTLAHFLSIELRKNVGVKPAVLLISPSDHQARLVSRKFEDLTEAQGFVRGDEERGSYTMDIVLESKLPETIESPYRFVLADDVSQCVLDKLLQDNRQSFKAASVVHTIDNRSRRNVAAET